MNESNTGSDSLSRTVKNKVKVWHDDHDTYHYEWREDCWSDSKLGIPTQGNDWILNILDKLNRRGKLYKFMCRFVLFEFIPEYGL